MAGLDTIKEHDGTDFLSLYKEGIDLIQKFAGSRWTNHNTADPGITMLEQICYAITDLSYRLSFNIEDILAEDHLNSKPQNFFTAGQILSTNPLTITDFRKILIDTAGIKNAYLEKGSLAGLYNVYIEKESDLWADDQIIKEAKAKLYKHRNLCEDFESIQIIETEEISLKAKIEICEDTPPEKAAAQIYLNLSRFIGTDIKFFTLGQMIEKGYTIDQIFSGPRLNNGFIEDRQLKESDKKLEIYISDIISLLHKIPGIKTAEKLLIYSCKSPKPQKWVLKTSPLCTAKLQNIKDLIQGGLQFYKNNAKCKISIKKTEEIIEQSLIENQNIIDSPLKNNLDIPKGRYRKLYEYEPMQNLFPENYGIGPAGPPDIRDQERIAKAKQLRAYITVFDQILCSLFAQLEHAKELLSFNFDHTRTYFKGNLFGIKKDICDEDYQNIEIETQDKALQRRVRLLDHLTAIFGEKFTVESSLIYDLLDKSSLPIEQRIEDQKFFLKNYPALSAKKGAGFNLYDRSAIWDTKNVSGFKLRLCAMLGIKETKRQTLYDSDQEGLHIIEHILLRPKGESFKISIIFPDWPKRFEDKDFRRLVYNTVYSQIPAHIEFSIYWIEKEKMQELETVYKDWLEKKVKDDPDADKAADGLIGVLISLI